MWMDTKWFIRVIEMEQSEEDIIRHTIKLKDIEEGLEKNRQEIMTMGKAILKRFKEEREEYEKSWRYRLFGRFFPTSTIKIKGD